jgi:hypothetical protein
VKSRQEYAALCAAFLLALPLAGQLTKDASARYQTPDGRKTVADGQAMTHIRLNKPEVIKEIEANHFRLVSEREQIEDSQYMLLLERD